MGDRANVCVKGESDGEVFLYTHWTGEELPRTVASALDRGRSRWGDTSYLTRIIFSEMIRDNIEGLTCFGISGRVQDNERRRPILVVDDDSQTVGIAKEDDPANPYQSVTYEEFITNPRCLPYKQDNP